MRMLRDRCRERPPPFHLNSALANQLSLKRALQIQLPADGHSRTTKLIAARRDAGGAAARLNQSDIAEREQATTSVRKDRFTMWPTALACCFPAILIVLWTGPFDLAFLGVPVLFMTWACSALLALGITIFSARARDWRRAISMSVLPLATLVAIANAGTIWPLAMETGERIHFQATRRSYLEDVSKLPSSGEPRFAMWHWGGFGIGHAVVYDESDEIFLPEPSSAWKKRVANTEVGERVVRGGPRWAITSTSLRPVAEAGGLVC